MLVGVDEAGRGPLVGVVAAAACALRVKPPFVIKDSKALSSQKRQEIFSWLQVNSYFAVDIATAAEIDELNILEATFLAFNRAISKLVKKHPELITACFIIDGNRFKTDLAINYKTRIRADRDIKEVSCASIIAKVTRDYLIKKLDFLYPEWKFNKHKGYPTKEHRELINKLTLTPFHRLTFSPCAKRIKL